MDTKFSVAVHILILISESQSPINSDMMAESVGTNASYIRKILAMLKKAGIVDGHKGISGYRLIADREKLTLLSIYRAVADQPNIHLFDIHKNPNDRCVVGRNIRPVLSDMFADLERQIVSSLDSLTLSDCIEGIRKRL